MGMGWRPGTDEHEKSLERVKSLSGLLAQWHTKKGAANPEDQPGFYLQITKLRKEAELTYRTIPAPLRLSQKYGSDPKIVLWGVEIKSREQSELFERLNVEGEISVAGLHAITVKVGVQSFASSAQCQAASEQCLKLLILSGFYSERILAEEKVPLAAASINFPGSKAVPSREVRNAVTSASLLRGLARARVTPTVSLSYFQPEKYNLHALWDHISFTNSKSKPDLELRPRNAKFLTKTATDRRVALIDAREHTGRFLSALNIIAGETVSTEKNALIANECEGDYANLSGSELNRVYGIRITSCIRRMSYGRNLFLNSAALFKCNLEKMARLAASEQRTAEAQEEDAGKRPEQSMSNLDPKMVDLVMGSGRIISF